MTSSRSSNVAHSILISFLALWSIVSLIVIVVWATSPDMKGASQCRSELQALQEKADKDGLNWASDRRAMTNMVMEGRANQTLLLNQTLQLREQVRLLNESLNFCLEENAILNENITSLENETKVLKEIEANLTAKISQQQDLIEDLHHNLTQTASKLKACAGLNDAAQILKQTAETETEACQNSQQYLEKQLSKCKRTSDPKGLGAPGPRSGIAWLLILIISLFLIP
ncbi:uncharacterized protein LOC143528826 [Brachyhypopomus gauderio]|uniref:uncharacterized protein LOC143528826 n=1 Tax=Brachyhypopomus gauderio TaxID=698409 RepID=UPI004043187F